MEKKKNKAVRLAALLLLIVASVFVMPQKTFAEGNEITYPTGDLKPNPPKQEENGGIATYGARGANYKGTDYQLYTTLENRVKKAMLAGKSSVDISDLNIRTSDYDLSYFYGYSPYFPSGLWELNAWFNDVYYTSLEINNSFGTVAETKAVYQEIDQKLDSIYELVDSSMSQEQKAITIHDYLTSHAEYDYSFSNYTSYGVLMDGTGVCQSYAYAYMYIMNHLGVETHFLPSAPMNHSWNVIKIDGAYYNVDCTFDDPTWNGADRYGAAAHEYFLRSTSEMQNLGHVFETEPYGCTSTKYQDAYWRNGDSPICYFGEKAYYVSNGSLYSYNLTNGSEEEVSNGLSWAGASLVQWEGSLYYITETQICRYDLETQEEDLFYDLENDEINGEIAGIMREGSRMYICVDSYDTGERMVGYFDLDEEDVADGWYQKGGSWMYYKNGMRLRGWQYLGGNWYLFSSEGIMKTGWQKVSEKWYYLNKSGAMTKGWQKIGGKWYYLDGSGVMKTGWQSVGGKWYYFNGSGVMQTGWQSIGGKWYYLDGNGVMKTGWQKLGSAWYYMNKSGIMQTNWQAIGGKWYYFSGSGVMQVSKWISGTYYVKADGTMAVSEWVDQNRYYVDANGKWVKNK